MPSVDLTALLHCPVCHHALSWSADEAHCQSCARTYPIVDGIPVLLPQPAGDSPHTASDEEHQHKAQQAAFYDEEDPEFEITRPHGTPRLYRWLLAEKSRRSLAGLPDVRGQTVLTVCGGSGMDADFLARSGARVFASDLSLGAARRTAERARRFGLDLLPLVADVEHLPFADRAVDLVYVHDGLHHLEDPTTGLREMARVAARALSLTEPCAASVTRLAVRLGLAQEIKDAGNRVARLDPAAIAQELQSLGFSQIFQDRYAMYYKHRPGPVMRALSLPGLCIGAVLAWRAANTVIGRFGNKMTIQRQRQGV